ncbi:MAG: hypothetical protein K8953_06925 [Proteobacteria bacterium]|nr:hypothetical protein [Pseudomonadota bacterium]
MVEVADTMYFIRPAPTEFYSSNVGVTRANQLANNAGTVGLSGITSRVGDGTGLGNGFREITQADPPVWSSPTTYMAGSTVRSPDGGLGNVYVALVNQTTNTGNDPDAEQRIKDNPFVRDPDDPFWQVVRKSSNNAFNDGRPNIAVGRAGTRFNQPGTLTVQLTTDDEIDTIALMNIRATEVSYTFRRNGVVSTKTAKLSNLDDISDWDEYLFRETNYARNHVFRNFPSESHPASIRDSDKLTITLRNPGGVASVGQIILGNEERIGEIDGDSINSDILDFSERTRDDFGQLDSTRRDATLSLQFRTIFARELTSFVQELFLEYRGGEPAVFFLTPNESFGTVVYGFWQEAKFSFFPNTDNLSIARITVEGLV